MLVEQRSHARPRSSAPPGPGPVAVRKQPAPSITPPHGVAAQGTRDDRLAPLLARAVQRRSGGPVLQRAIIAINGASDKKTAREITVNCLVNLKSRPSRGPSVGPLDIDPTTAGMIVPPTLGKNDSLYILGHGNTDEIGDFDPDELGAAIIGWYGTQAFRGKVKLVACSSGIVDSIGQSYAERVNAYLTANATASFRPKSVDGVLGIAWVHETGGNIVAIDESKYDEHETANRDVEGAFAEKDPQTRKQALETLFGRPDKRGSSTHTGKPGAKVRYFTNLPSIRRPPAGRCVACCTCSCPASRKRGRRRVRRDRFATAPSASARCASWA